MRGLSSVLERTWNAEMQWVVRHLIWSLETAVSIEDRMPKLADIISVHQSCRVAKVSRQSLSAIPCDILFQTGSRFYSLSVHKACVSHRVSLSWQQKLFVCGGVSWGKRFCKDSKLFVHLNLFGLRIQRHLGKSAPPGWPAGSFVCALH